MFPDSWKRCPLGDIAQITSGGTPDRSEPSYWGGDIPWVTTSEIRFKTITDTAEKITDAGLKSSAAKLFPPGTLLLAMYGQGKTRGQVAKLGVSATTNQACAAILLKDGNDANFYYQVLASKYQSLRELGNAGTQQNLNGAIVKQVAVPVPPPDEQKGIAEVLAVWDKAIATTERLLVTSRNQKQALMSNVLTGKRRVGRFRSERARMPTPHGSIPGDWTYPRIGSIANEVSQKHGGGQAYPVLSCTKHEGLVDSLRYFKKQVFSKDLSTYKVVPRGCFAYATNHIEEGSIGYQDLYDFGLVSPMYTVFKTTDEVHDGYLYRLLKTEHFRQIFAATTNSSVDRRGSLRWNDFKRLHVPLPPMEEQLAIAELLDRADQEIELIEKQITSLRSEKMR